jgi:predicted RNA binding protein YcfA (HicA-like mRNA interferase family)
MPKFPIISGKEAIRAFQRIGYVQVRQKGSHVRLIHPTKSFLHKPLSIPLHKTLGPGLLRKLVRDANISTEEFIKLL